MSRKPGFMLYNEWRETLMSLPPVSLQELLNAMYEYNTTGKTPCFTCRDASLVWGMLRGRMDYDTKRYENMVQQRTRAANKRWAKTEEEPPAPPRKTVSQRSWAEEERARYEAAMDRYLDF